MSAIVAAWLRVVAALIQVLNAHLPSQAWAVLGAAIWHYWLKARGWYIAKRAKVAAEIEGLGKKLVV